MIIDRDKICWLLVADSGSANFYFLQTHPLHIEQVPEPRLRSHDSQRHGAVHQEKKDRFTAKVAAAIAEVAGKKLLQSLIVVAPPHMLGELREDLTADLRHLISLEIPADWAAMNTSHIVEHLKAHLFPAQ